MNDADHGSITIERVTEPGDSHRSAILEILGAYNASAGPAAEARDVALTATMDSRIVGGLWGRIGYRWLFVQYLALDAGARGQGLGTKLMQAAEAEAVSEGCIGIWLDAFSFQARGFYERLGYSEFGRLDDFPPGESRFFLHKRIA